MTSKHLRICLHEYIKGKLSTYIRILLACPLDGAISLFLYVQSYFRAILKQQMYTSYMGDMLFPGGSHPFLY